MEILGGCLCRATRYRSSAPPIVTRVCWCRVCQYFAAGNGTGGCAFLAGGVVQGGRVIADWPGLTRKALLDGRDVRPTLDLRSVFKAVLADHIRIEPLALAARVFPNSQGAPPLHGLIRA